MSKSTHAEALQTKRSILDAAAKVFSANGFAKTSLSDIARDADVTRGAIYWHFENKTELLSALLEDEAQKLKLVSTLRAAANEQQRDPLGILRQWSMMHFSEDSRVFFNSSIMSIFEGIIHNNSQVEARERLEELLKTRAALIEEAIRNAVVHRQLPPDTDIELAATYLQASLQGLIMQMRQGYRNLPVEQYQLIVDTIFAHIGELRRTAG